jgi:hypothetical protein
MVESQPSKLLVAGPIPVSRSIFSTTDPATSPFRVAAPDGRFTRRTQSAAPPLFSIRYGEITKRTPLALPGWVRFSFCFGIGREAAERHLVNQEEAAAGRLSIGLFTIFDGVNAEDVAAFFGEADAKVADPQTELRRLGALEFFHAASAGLGQAVNGA